VDAFDPDRFTIADFCERLHREDRAETLVNHLEPVRRRRKHGLRTIIQRDVDNARATQPYHHDNPNKGARAKRAH